MMELILEYTDIQKAKVFNILRTNKMMILLDNKCILILHLSEVGYKMAGEFTEYRVSF